MGEKVKVTVTVATEAGKEKNIPMKMRRKKKRALDWKGQLLLIVLMITAAVMLPVTLLLLVGMMPTIAVGFMDKSPERMKAFTVGALNFASCFPFVIELIDVGFNTNAAFAMIMDAQNIIIMFSGAIAGYLIEWATVGFVAAIMIEQAKAKMKNMKEKQEELVERWGREVTGDIPLDPQGFALENIEQS